jgi:hypothetical protein
MLEENGDCVLITSSDTFPLHDFDNVRPDDLLRTVQQIEELVSDAQFGFSDN